MLLLILKSSACLAVFMVFYKLFLEKESMHHFKRFYLLGALGVSIVIPFITFTQYIEVAPIENLVSFSPNELTTTQGLIPETKVNWQDYVPTILWSIYLLGVLLFSFRFAINLRAILHRIKANPKHHYHEFTNVLLQDLIHPHTFFKYIFLNKAKYENNLIPNAVLLHEQTHAKQKHALDILCIEVIQIIFWFNPLLYFIKKDIKLNHEFLADQAVLQKGIDSSQYKQTLLTFSSNATEPQLTNAINYSLIKKRFTVMKTRTSKRIFRIKGLLILPIIAILIYGFSEKEIVEKEIAALEPIAIQQTTTDNGATDTMMEEYKEFIQEFEKTNTIWTPKLNRAKAIYDLMTDVQRSTVKKYPKTPPINLAKVKPKIPTDVLLNSWKNKEKFAIWIDGKVVDNTELNNYLASDFKYYTSSFVYNNARSSKFPQAHQNHLYTKKGFEESYLKRNTNKYNSLKKEYLNEEKEHINSDLNDNSELRILKSRLDKLYNALSKEEIKKYNVEKVESKISFNTQKEATKEQIKEYNKIAKSISSQPEGKQIIKVKDLKRLKYLYELMSAEQKRNAEPFPKIAPMPPPPLPKNATDAQKRKYKEAIRDAQVASKVRRIKADKEKLVQVREIRTAEDRKKLEQEKRAYRETQVAARALKQKDRIKVREIQTDETREKIKQEKLAYREAQIAAKVLKHKAQKERVQVREIRSTKDREKLKQEKLAYKKAQVAARAQKVKDGKKRRIMVREIMPPPPPLPENATPEQKRKYEAAVKAYKRNQVRRVKERKNRKIEDVPPPPPIPETASAEEREQMIEVREAYHNEVENLNEIEIEEIPELEEVEVEAIENVVEIQETAIEEVELEEINEVPPPPLSPLDHIKKMAEKGAKFIFNGKAISSKKAIKLIRTSEKMSVMTNHSGDTDYVVTLSTEPIVVRE